MVQDVDGFTDGRALQHRLKCWPRDSQPKRIDKHQDSTILVPIEQYRCHPFKRIAEDLVGLDACLG